MRYAGVCVAGQPLVLSWAATGGRVGATPPGLNFLGTTDVRFWKAVVYTPLLVYTHTPCFLGFLVYTSILFFC